MKIGLYEQYQINLIDETGARNFYEACLIERIREHLPQRHRITNTTGGKRIKADWYWVKRTIRELRSYRKFLNWLEKNPVVENRNEQLSILGLL